MNLISKNKEKLINFLRFLNTKPGFRRVFYWVHEIRCTPFKPHNFIAVLIDNTFLLGVYDMESSPTWKRMATIGFERNETDLIKKLSNQFDVFIDIGAHIGYFCCLVGKHNPEASIFAFEPSPENFKSLTKNIDINKITKVKTYNVGLSNKSGTATLYGNDAMSSFNFNSFGGQPKIQATIKIETLNSFTKDIPINRRVFIKMDVEAKEYDVLRGANNFIKEIKPIGLLVEICDEWSGGINPHFKDTFDIIHKLGYKSYLIGDQFPLTETNDISKLRGANYLFIRNDLVEDIRKKTKLI